MGSLRAIAATVLALGHRAQLVHDQALAERRHAVDKHLALQVVELVLHDAGQIALHPLVVLLGSSSR